jgi:hypothetical protein
MEEPYLEPDQESKGLFGPTTLLLILLVLLVGFGAITYYAYTQLDLSSFFSGNRTNTSKLEREIPVTITFLDSLGRPFPSMSVYYEVKNPENNELVAKGYNDDSSQAQFNLTLFQRYKIYTTQGPGEGRVYPKDEDIFLTVPYNTIVLERRAILSPLYPFNDPEHRVSSGVYHVTHNRTSIQVNVGAVGGGVVKNLSIILIPDGEPPERFVAWFWPAFSNVNSSTLGPLEFNQPYPIGDYTSGDRTVLVFQIEEVEKSVFSVAVEDELGWEREELKIQVS